MAFPEFHNKRKRFPIQTKGCFQGNLPFVNINHAHDMHMEILFGNNTRSEMKKNNNNTYKLKRSILFSLQESCTYSDLVSEKIHCLLHDVKIARQIIRTLSLLTKRHGASWLLLCVYQRDCVLHVFRRLKC